MINLKITGSIFISVFELLTRGLHIEGHNEAHYGQNSQVHDAGDAEEEPSQAVIYTGNISPEPVVAPGRGYTQGIHGNSCSQVCHCQIHAKQLQRLHF